MLEDIHVCITYLFFACYSVIFQACEKTEDVTNKEFLGPAQPKFKTVQIFYSKNGRRGSVVCQGLEKQLHIIFNAL